METPPIEFILEPDQEAEARGTWWGAARDLKEGDVIDFTDSHGTLWRATVTGTETRDPDRDDRFTIPLTRVDQED